MEQSFLHVHGPEGGGSPAVGARPPPIARAAAAAAADPSELRELERKERELRADCEMFRTQLALLERDRDRERLDDREFERSQQRLTAEEGDLRRQHTEVTEQKEYFEKNLADLRADAADLDRQEQQYWHDYNAFTVRRAGFAHERDMALAVFRRLTEQYEELSSTNVYNDSFYIWHDGNFGTINGFRLGTLRDQPVEWPEINAAWGQVVLLLHTMVKQKGFEFQNRELKPMGSFSQIVEGTETLDLHNSSGWFTSFDRGMIAFLQCLKEFGEYAESSDSSFKLPYHIEGDKIGATALALAAPTLIPTQLAFGLLTGALRSAGVLSKADKWFPIKKRFEKDENCECGLVRAGLLSRAARLAYMQRVCVRDECAEVYADQLEMARGLALQKAKVTGFS